MTRWTEDASDQVAEAGDAALGEIYDRDAWDFDDYDRTPTRAEVEADAYLDWLWDQEQRRKGNAR